MTALGREPRSRGWHLAAWLTALGVILWLLAGLGSGPLAAPPLGDASALGEWQASRTPPEALLSVVRLLALALGWYLMTVTVLGALARLLRWGRLVVVADTVTVPAVRQLLRGALGVGLAAGVITAGPAAAIGPLRMAAAATSEVPSEPEPPAAALPAPDEALADPSPLWGLPIDGPDHLPEPLSPGSKGQNAAEPAIDRGGIDWADTEAHEEITDPSPGADEPALHLDGASHTIEPGEHLWAVAARTLEQHSAATPTETEVAAYWLELIERNRDRLPDPTDPDLVHPGTVLALPPLPPS